MRLLREAAFRLRSLLSRERDDREMDEEIRFHLAMEIAANIARGMSPEQARHRAMVAFGGVERYREEAREARSLGVLEEAALDLRSAWRALKRHRTFSITAFLTLAIGIGASTAIFSILDGVVLRPLPFPEADRLVQLSGANVLTGDADAVRSFPLIREQSTSLSALSGYEAGARYVRDGGGVARVTAVSTEQDFFAVLRAPPLLGRTYAAGDDSDVAVVSESFWRRHLGGDRAADGWRILINDRPVTVVGVMPADFQFPYGAASLLQSAAQESRTDLWMPFARPLGPRGRIRNVVARLAPGVSIEDARAEMTLLAARIRANDPEIDAAYTLTVLPLNEAVVGASVRRPLMLMLTAVGLVLLLVCANVANLTLVRMTLRRREVAVRLALGARRVRLVRQLLVESLLLAGAAGVAGLGVAWLATRWSASALAALVPRAFEVGIDWRVFLFLVTVCIVTAVATGLTPALLALGGGRDSSLREADGHASMGKGEGRLRDGLLIAEVALACTLALGAGLLVRELVRLQGMESGLRSENVLTLHLGSRIASDDDGSRYYAIADRVSIVPGVQAAGVTQMLPLQSWGWTSNSNDFFHHGSDVRQTPEYDIELRYVTPGYFEALGIAIRGRGFTEADDARGPPVILINEALARRHFGDADPIGVEMNRGRIVGVVRDVRQAGLDRPAAPEIYFPIAQNWSHLSELGMTLVVKTAGAPEGMIEAVRAAVAEVDPGQAIFGVRTMKRVIRDSLAKFTLYLALMTAFALLALLLAAGGVYSVVSYLGASRVRELAIRAALGAGPSVLVAMLVRRGTFLIASGVALGTAAAWLATPLLQAETLVTDPPGPELLPVALGIGLIALLACLVPARRAGRTDPMIALRSD